MKVPIQPRTVGVLQARLSSSRFPGKVLEPLAGRPMIGFMIERLRRSRSIDELVLATSVEESDTPLAELVEGLGIRVVRGPLEDVLTRFAFAASLTDPDIIVRLTGDCPLIDPTVVDRVVQEVGSGRARYASNVVPASYPDGLDCEAFTVDLLHAAASDARLSSEREHVTPWIRNAAGRTATVQCSIDLSTLRWTVDYPDDLERVRRMVQLLGDRAIDADLFDMLRVHDLLGKVENAHVRNEGYAKSLIMDSEVE